MNSQKAFSTIELLVLIVVLLIFGVGSALIYRTPQKANRSTPAPTPTATPVQTKPTNAEIPPTGVTASPTTEPIISPIPTPICGNDICEPWEQTAQENSNYGCDPVPDNPHSCDNPYFCPQDCAKLTPK